MLPLANILLHPALRPPAHGAVGPWDEVLNIVPLVVGAALLAYLYFGKRKGRAASPQPPEAEMPPPPPPDDQPRA